MIDHFIAGLLFISVAFVLVVIGLRCLWPARPPLHTGDHNWKISWKGPTQIDTNNKLKEWGLTQKDLDEATPLPPLNDSKRPLNNHIRINHISMDDEGPKPMSFQEKKELLKKWDEALNAQIDPKKNKKLKQKPITLSSSKRRKSPRKKK